MGLGPRTPAPSLQSHSFSRGCGTILPTSLIYIALSTRGCSPWRPDAVMSTTGRENEPLPRIFTDCRERAGQPQDLRCFACRAALSPAEPIPGRLGQLRRKENSSRGSRQRLRVRSRRRPPSTLRLGNINPIPFRRAGRRKRPRSAELSCPLGSAHPCPTAVHMEPFSTSVFKVLI